MLLIDIIFCAEALDGISIVYNSVRMFIIQVFKTFSRPSHLVSCPSISFDRHAWNVQDCLGLAQVAEFSPFLGRPIYCKNTKKRDWNFLLLTTYRHQTEFHKELSTNIEWSSTNDSIFLKYAAPELKKNNSSGAHLLYSWCILKDWLHTYQAFFSIRFFSYSSYDRKDICLISSSERSSNPNLELRHPQEHQKLPSLSFRLHLARCGHFWWSDPPLCLSITADPPSVLQITMWSPPKSSAPVP